MITYHSNFKKQLPFYSIELAARINQILKPQTHSSDNQAFLQEILKVANFLDRKSPLLPILYSLTSNGDLIVLDEPFTFLTEEETEDLTHIIHTAKEVGKSVIIATHNIEWI